MLEFITAALVKLGATATMATVLAGPIATSATTPKEAAFLVTWGRYESGFRERIMLNQCKAWECDRGRARGVWQLHQAAAGSAWDALPGDPLVQAHAAARMARFALKTCHGEVRCAFRVLGGLPPSMRLPGEDYRVATYYRVRGMIGDE